MTLPPFQKQSPGDETAEDRKLAETAAMGKVGGAHPLRNQGAHPGVPGRGAGHAGRPIEAHGNQQLPRLGMPAQGPPDERQKTDGLHRRRGHHPAPVRPQPAHRQRRHQLEHRPHEQRGRCGQPSCHRAEAERQAERRDVVLPAADHHAVGRGVGGGDPEIAAEPRPRREATGEELHDPGTGPRRAGGQGGKVRGAGWAGQKEGRRLYSPGPL